MADDPSTAGAEEDDIVAGGHGGDDAMALGGVALERVDGEDLPTSVHSGRDRVNSRSRLCCFNL